MRPFQIYFILFITTVLPFSSCSDPDVKEGEQHLDNLIQITNDQFKFDNMKLGNVEMHSFTQNIKASGVVTASPQAKADVYSYVSGIIKSISVNPGNPVQKGEQLCTIASKDFIYLQQQYLIYLANLKSTTVNHLRIKQLYNEKVSSHKDFLAIESEYNVLNAQIKAIKAELNILNIDIENLENGNLLTYLSILSPIDGTITKIDCNLGQFVNSQGLLMKIVDTQNLQLHFFAYQESVNKFQLGQDLIFYSPDNTEINNKAHITSIGKSIDKDSKSIRCIAEIDGSPGQGLIDGMYFQVEVIIDTINVRALPSEAIIKSGNKYFILVKDKQDDNSLFFRSEEINIGISSDGFTQIIGDTNIKDVLIVGAYYFNMD